MSTNESCSPGRRLQRRHIAQHAIGRGRAGYGGADPGGNIRDREWTGNLEEARIRHAYCCGSKLSTGGCAVPSGSWLLPFCGGLCSRRDATGAAASPIFGSATATDAIFLSRRANTSVVTSEESGLNTTACFSTTRLAPRSLARSPTIVERRLLHLHHGVVIGLLHRLPLGLYIAVEFLIAELQRLRLGIQRLLRQGGMLTFQIRAHALEIVLVARDLLGIGLHRFADGVLYALAGF